MNPSKLTWDELRKRPQGAILYDKERKGCHLIIRFGGASLCAYIGVPRGHRLAEKELDMPCHGGVTFFSYGDTGCCWRKDWFYWGWDYAHSGDCLLFHDDMPGLASVLPLLKKWDFGDVKKELEEVYKWFIKSCKGRRKA